MPQGGEKGGRREYKPRARKYTTEAAKSKLIELVQDGLTIQAACDKVGYSRKWYEAHRRADKPFADKVDQARQLRKPSGDIVRGERLGFAEWRKKYLGVSTPWHQMQWVDLLENREPRDLHPSQTFEKNKSNRLLVNCPPFHPVVPSTPILTGEGWRTVGDVQKGDVVFDPMGRATKVIDTWESEGETYEVEFATGDVIVADARHLWHVENVHGKAFEKATAELANDLRYANGAAKWRVRVSQPASGRGLMGEEIARDLPVDPYVLGYWLGDGDTNGSRIAVSEDDLDSICKQLGDAGYDFSVRPQRGGHSIYVKKFRKLLREAGVFGHKHIPDAYASATPEVRMALLQGLMDSDGSVTDKDGRCYFAQNEVLRGDLVRDVYRLVASLGFLPRKRDESKWGPNPTGGEPYFNHQTRIYFTPKVPVFRLERKVAKQSLGVPTRGETRRIVDIRPTGRVEPVKCLSVLAGRYQFGDGCIDTRNGKSVALTIHYSVYRLCMDPGFRILIISAGSELAKDFLFGIKQILSSPDFIDLQKTYAPEGGWETTAESWTETRIVFGTAVRAQSNKAFHEKDANVLALGMRSKVYGRRADLIIVDDGVDTTNVSEHAKQLKWLRGMVESRLEAGGKLLVIGTRVSPVDLYSELRKPENYANGRVPWTYLASPAILEEGERPEDHKTLWPWADAPWVSPEDAAMDECLCENTAECSAGFDTEDGRKFPRWDGIHLENGPRASNNNTDWALIFQQSSVADDATFPEYAVQRAVNGSRQAGLLKANTVGHPPLGMNGMYVIAGLDPAIKGFAGMVVVAVDRETKMRYLLNAWNMKAPTAAELKQKMREVTPSTA